VPAAHPVKTLVFTAPEPLDVRKHLYPGLARVGKIKFELFFPGFWPNLGPGRRPLDSDRRDAKFAGVFAFVAFLTISFVPNPGFGIRPKKKVKMYMRARPGYLLLRSPLVSNWPLGPATVPPERSIWLLRLAAVLPECSIRPPGPAPVLPERSKLLLSLALVPPERSTYW